MNSLPLGVVPGSKKFLAAKGSKAMFLAPAMTVVELPALLELGNPLGRNDFAFDPCLGLNSALQPQAMPKANGDAACNFRVNTPRASPLGNACRGTAVLTKCVVG
mmetsp:Transcript_5785/g.13740  ORF Transcript_5785/g.13740 Transcript_5785/m.13740 type:complete len:105 (+) Transcript_5785:668-982(+)